MKKLFLILLVASILRFIDLANVPNGLYWDEMDVGYQAYSLLKTGKDYFGNAFPLFPHSFSEYRTPLFIYSSVLSTNSVRIPAVIWGILSIAAIYCLTKLIAPKASYISALVMTFSPWNFVYSRISFEVITLVTMLTLSIALFIRSLRKAQFLPFATLFFGLSLYTYSTAKLFIPLILLLLLIQNFKKVISVPKKYLVVSILTLLLFAVPVYLDSFFGKSAGRFHNVSILTDPVIGSTVNQERFESTISRLDGTPQVGLSPTFLDKLLYNRPVTIAKNFLGNYLSAYSVDFLFTKGDPLIRHSPDKNWHGQLNLFDAFPLLLGLTVLTKKRFRFLGIWLLLAPIPSALTRDGATHASRLILLLPPLIIFVSIGLVKILNYSKLLFSLFTISYCMFLFTFLGYYFTRYRLDSARDFNWGFEQIVASAIQESSKYDHVFIDTRNESALMAFLYTTKYDPLDFHSLHPLKNIEYTDGFSGFEFGKIVIMDRGTRHWHNSKIAGNNLVISTSDQPLLDTLNPKVKTINYPDQTPAFYFFLSNLSKPSILTPK